MSANFLIDFSLFQFLGVLAGLDWQIAFILATGLAMITRYGTMWLAHHRIRLYGVRQRANHDALPANRSRNRK
jgi:hypothetical protein